MTLLNTISSKFSNFIDGDQSLQNRLKRHQEKDKSVKTLSNLIKNELDKGVCSVELRSSIMDALTNKSSSSIKLNPELHAEVKKTQDLHSEKTFWHHDKKKNFTIADKANGCLLVLGLVDSLVR